MEIDPTMVVGVFDTTGVNPGKDADVTQYAGVNFREQGRNPAGIADWEQKWEIVMEMRRYRAAWSYVAELLNDLANGERA